MSEGAASAAGAAADHGASPGYEEVAGLLASLQYRERVLEVTFRCPETGMEQVGRCLYQGRHLRGPVAGLWRQALGAVHPGEGNAIRLQRGPQQAVLEAFDSVRDHFGRDPGSGQWVAAQSLSSPPPLRAARQALFARLCSVPGDVIEILLRGWGLVSGLGMPDLAEAVRGLSEAQRLSLCLVDGLYKAACGRREAAGLVPSEPEATLLVEAAVAEASASV